MIDFRCKITDKDMKMFLIRKSNRIQSYFFDKSFYFFLLLVSILLVELADVVAQLTLISFPMTKRLFIASKALAAAWCSVNSINAYGSLVGLTKGKNNPKCQMTNQTQLLRELFYNFYMVPSEWIGPLTVLQKQMDRDYQHI